MSDTCSAFELRRNIDDLVYTFERKVDQEGRVGFMRTDGEIWIIRHERFGWVVGSWNSDEVFGRPWHVLPSDQGGSPPEGIWVSRKGSKSYVYDLVYV